MEPDSPVDQNAGGDSLSRVRPGGQHIAAVTVGERVQGVTSSPGFFCNTALTGTSISSPSNGRYTSDISPGGILFTTAAVSSAIVMARILPGSGRRNRMAAPALGCSDLTGNVSMPIGTVNHIRARSRPYARRTSSGMAWPPSRACDSRHSGARSVSTNSLWDGPSVRPTALSRRTVNSRSSDRWGATSRLGTLTCHSTWREFTRYSE